ncbi:hypothetical protein FB107DRAFT_291903 [Schizophyllum commune]
MSIRMSTMALEVRGNALDVAHTLTLVAARQRHYHPPSVKIIKRHRPATTSRLQVPLGCLQELPRPGRFPTLWGGPNNSPHLALFVKRLLRDVETHFRHSNAPALHASSPSNTLNTSTASTAPRSPTHWSESKEQESTRVPQKCVPQDPLGIGESSAGGLPAPGLNVAQG